MNTLALTVAEKHQRRVAVDTLRMNNAFSEIMGGVTKAEARRFLRSLGYSDESIADIEAGKVGTVEHPGRW